MCYFKYLQSYDNLHKVEEQSGLFISCNPLFQVLENTFNTGTHPCLNQTLNKMECCINQVSTKHRTQMLVLRRRGLDRFLCIGCFIVADTLYEL